MALLQNLIIIKVGDLIILRARVTCTFQTSFEVSVEVLSEEILTGAQRVTSRAFLTFVAVDADGRPVPVPPLLAETAKDKRLMKEAHRRRKARLETKLQHRNELDTRH